MADSSAQDLLSQAQAIQNQKLLEQAQSIQQAKLAEANKPPEVSGPEAALLGGEAGLSLGLRPIGAGVGAALGDISGRDKPSLKSASEAFTQGRHEAIAEQENAQAQHPWLYGGANIIGSLPTAAILPGISSVGKAAAVGGGVGALNAVGTSESIPDAASKVGLGAILGAGLYKGLGYLGDKMSSSPKTNEAEISAAASRLGVEPTPGMLSGSERVQGMESSLAQNPTLPAYGVREKLNAVQSGIKKGVEGIIAPGGGQSAYESGLDMSRDITGGLGSTYNNIQAAYEPFNQELPKMIPTAEDFGHLAHDIHQIGDRGISLKDNFSNFAKTVNANLDKAKNLEDVETIRKGVGAVLSEAHATGNKPAVNTISEIYDRLADFTDDQFIKMSKDAMPQGGAQIGKSMVSEYQAAKDMYSSHANEIKEVAKSMGIKGSNPRALLEQISTVDPEKLANSAFDTKSYQSLRAFKQLMPDVFEQARLAKINEIAAKSTDTTGELNYYGFANRVQRLYNERPEIAQELLGDKAQVFKDVQTLRKAIPERIGPSGTPQGRSFSNILNVGENLSALGARTAYEARSPFDAGSGIQTNAMGPLINQSLITNKPAISNVIRTRDKLQKGK